MFRLPERVTFQWNMPPAAEVFLSFWGFPGEYRGLRDPGQGL